MHPTRRKMTTRRENHTHLFGNVYIVRTLAGYRQAIKHFRGTDPDLSDLLPEDAPTSWPAVLELTRTYIGGGHSIEAQAIHVNELKALLENQ